MKHFVTIVTLLTHHVGVSVRPFLLSFLHLVHEALANITSEICSRTERIRINWDGEPTGNAENPYNWIFI